MDNKYSVYDYVKCVSLPPKNHEGLVIGNSYRIMGLSEVYGDIVYSLKDQFGNTIYSRDYFEKESVTSDTGCTSTSTPVCSPDPVNHPSHYMVGGIETIDIIQSLLTPEEFVGYLKGNILKYRERAEFKGKPDEDRKKARWYFDKLKEENVK